MIDQGRSKDRVHRDISIFVIFGITHCNTFSVLAHVPPFQVCHLSVARLWVGHIYLAPIYYSQDFHCLPGEKSENRHLDYRQRVARSEQELKWERDRFQDAVDVKLAILRGLEKEAQEG